MGSTTWNFSNLRDNPSFGQLTQSISTRAADTAGAALTTTISYVHDARGRVSEVTTTLNEGNSAFVRSYTERFTFDQFGRPFQTFDASGDSRGVRYLYNPRGYLEQIREAREGGQGQVYWTVTHMDARGNVTRAVLGNGMELLRVFDPIMGRLTDLIDSAGAQVAKNQKLLWDQLDRLMERWDLRTSHQERFSHDGRNRLTPDRGAAGHGRLERTAAPALRRLGQYPVQVRRAGQHRQLQPDQPPELQLPCPS